MRINANRRNHIGRCGRKDGRQAYSERPSYAQGVCTCTVHNIFCLSIDAGTILYIVRSKVSHNDGSTTVVAASKSRLKMTIGDLKNDIDAGKEASACDVI